MSASGICSHCAMTAFYRVQTKRGWLFYCEGQKKEAVEMQRKLNLETESKHSADRYLSTARNT